MTSNTLDELDRAVLESIADGRKTVDALETRFDAPRERLEERLAQLVENGLARSTAAEGYELTENGRRVMSATPRGTKDDRIDTPAQVDRAIEESDLPPDEAAAVRSAFSFLQYWGEATTAEILDATYSEAPAGYDAPRRWWDECVRDRLAGLPDVAQTGLETVGGGDGTPETSDGTREADDCAQETDDGRREIDDETWTLEWWEYEGTAIVDREEGVNGRAVRDPPSAPAAIGSVRHGLERLDLTREERMVARIAFAVLYDRGTATASELLEGVAEVCSAGGDSEGWGVDAKQWDAEANEGWSDDTDEGWSDDSDEEWAAWLSSLFGPLDSVERESGGDEAIWMYE